MKANSKWQILRELTGFVALAVTVLLVISLFTYRLDDPSLNSYLTEGGEVKNSAGIFGAYLSDVLVQLSGAVAWLAPVSMLYIGIALIRGVKKRYILLALFGLTLLALSISGLVNIYFDKADPIFNIPVSAGLFGALVARQLTLPWLAEIGSTVTLFALTIFALLIIFRISIGEISNKASSVSMRAGYRISKMFRAFYRAAKRIKIPILMDSPDFKNVREKRKRIKEKSQTKDEIISELGATDEGGFISVAPSATEGADHNENSFGLPAPNIVDFAIPNDLSDEPLRLPAGRRIEDEDGIKRKRGKKGKGDEDVFQQEIFELSDDSQYEYPSLNLLDTSDNPVIRQNDDDLIKASRILERKLLDFGVEGRVTQVLPGPVITIYEFEPAPGIKVSKIASLADDLAMSLRAMSIRILAPIPGKSVVGVEVPNVSREAVSLKDILASDEARNGKEKMPLALGKDVSGRPLLADLAKVPHLLIAGSTGSGKSVGLNAMICSILYSRSPSEVKFIMVDPKMLELSIYDGIPHLIAPVVTNAKKAANALKWVVGEMERRYALLAELGVRNIGGYNSQVEKNRKEMVRKGIDPADLAKNFGLDGEGEEPILSRDSIVEKLPYIVVVIDELADLMMVASKDVEDSLARLAQMARAAGIHLIVATQRPSVDVLTGLIKANFPARISFQVRSRTDSRTILDSMGAEKLLGKGDMLFLPPGASAMLRIQGPFVSDDEIHRVVNFLKKQSKPEYNEDIMRAAEENITAGMEEDDMDEYYDQAVELVARTKQASVSSIQRRLRIGYNRAARIVEVMERQGLVGPADGAKPREVFVRPIEETETTYNV